MILAKENIHQLPQHQPKTTPTKRVRKVTKTKINPRAVYILICAIAFTVGIVFTSRYAQLAVTGYRVDEMKEQMQALELQNQNLAAKVNSLKSLNRIEQVAVSDLGMVKPEGVQFIAVEDKAIEKNSISADDAKEKVNSNSQKTVVADRNKERNVLNDLQRMLLKAKANLVTRAATAGE